MTIFFRHRSTRIAPKKRQVTEYAGSWRTEAPRAGERAVPDQAMELLAEFFRELEAEVTRANVQKQQLASHLDLGASSVTEMFKSGRPGGYKKPPSWERVELILRFCWEKTDHGEFPGVPAAAATRRRAAAQARYLEKWKVRHAVLVHDMDRAKAAVTASHVPEVRSSLPSDAAVFTGRADERARIMDAADAGGVWTIEGMPGVGKTALAVHVARLLRGRFPDRQLFVNLHAHTPGREPVRPEDALAGLLAATGVDPRSLPDDLDKLAAMWRDKMARQRALLVLDNAASSSQVAPLLPGDEGCLVLVTSRRHLGDLPGAVTPVLLGALPPEQAEEMFVRLAPRVADTPGEVAEVVRLAGFLPLAISLLARVFARHWKWTLANLAAETRAGVLTLTAEEDSIAAAFEVSYRHLDPARQRFFCLLGLNPGTTIDVYAGAALAGTSLDQATGLLDGLHREGLLTETGYRRYDMHDLLRRYARDRAAADPVADGQRALDRLLDYYLHTAARAEAWLARQTRPGPAPAISAGLLAFPLLDDADQALAWARGDRASLLACLDHVTGASQHARVIAFTAALTELLRRDGPWADAITRHTAAIRAAQDLGDRCGEANARNDLGTVRRLTGDYPVAAQAFEQALGIYRDIGERRGEANVLNNLGTVRALKDDYPGAAQAHEQALGIYRELGDRRGEATALNNLGDIRWLTGDYPGAVQACEQALDIYRGLGDRRGEATALNNLGDVWRLTGEHPAAAQACEQALGIFRGLGDRRGEANALSDLGHVRQLMGKYPDAAQDLEQALGIFRDLGDRRGEATARAYLGVVRRLTDEYPDAARNLEQALDIFRDLGDQGGEAEVLNETGALHRVTGDLVRAEGCHDQALELARSIDSPWDEGQALAGLGRCARDSGHTTEAQARLRRAQEIFGRIGAAEARAVLAELNALNRPAADG